MENRYEDPVWKVERQLADLCGERLVLIDTMTQANVRLQEISREQEELLTQLYEIRGVQS